MKTVFLDRDGVINKYPGDTKYVTSWKGFHFLPRAKRAIARLHGAGFKLFVISNQAGVGKGVFSQAALDRITENMLQGIESSGGRICAVYYCTHRPDENCSCRKPKTGFIQLAKKMFKLKGIRKAYFIGDTIRDVHTAHNAGCKSVLVLCGKEKESNRQLWEAEPDYVFSDLACAADFIINKAKKR